MQSFRKIGLHSYQTFLTKVPPLNFWQIQFQQSPILFFLLGCCIDWDIFLETFFLDLPLLIVFEYVDSFVNPNISFEYGISSHSLFVCGLFIKGLLSNGLFSIGLFVQLIEFFFGFDHCLSVSQRISSFFSGMRECDVCIWLVGIVFFTSVLERKVLVYTNLNF